jgi:hypothetical protein
MTPKCRHARKLAEAVLTPVRLWPKKQALNDGFWVLDSPTEITPSEPAFPERAARQAQFVIITVRGR